MRPLRGWVGDRRYNLPYLLTGKQHHPEGGIKIAIFAHCASRNLDLLRTGGVDHGDPGLP